MDFSYKLIDFKTYEYNQKKYIKFSVYCKASECTIRIIKLYSDTLLEFAENYLDRDIFDNLSFKVSRDGITKLDISI